MFTWKRSSCAALSGLLTLSVILTGCKSAGGASQKTSGSDLKPYNIVWYTYCKPQKDTPAVAEAVSKYLKDKINASLTINEIDTGDYKTKMPVIIASQEKFDICFTANWANNYFENASKGAFVDLTSTGLLDKYGKDIKKVVDPTLLAGSSIDGKLFAVPVNKEAAYQWGYFLNKTYVDKYHMDTSKIKTIADIEPLLKTIKENEPDVVPLLGGGGTGNMQLMPYDPIISQNFPVGMKIGDSSKKMVNLYETDEVKSLFQTMHTFYQAGYIPKDALTKDFTTSLNAGKIFATIVAYTPDVEYNYHGLSVVYCPLEKPIVAGTAGTGAMQAISNTSSDKNRAMMFLNLLYTDKTLLNMIGYGIEGRNYVKKGDNVAALPDGVTSSTSTYSTNVWTVGNEFLSYLQPTDTATKWDKFKAFNKDAVQSPALGFNFDSTNVASEVAQINTVISQYYPSLMCGAVDPATYLPQFNSKLKAAGLDTVVKEAQNQFNKWSSTKK